MVAKAKTYLKILSTIALLTACSFNPSRITDSGVYRGFALEAPRPYPIDLVWRSSLRALDSLKISIIRRSHSNDSGQIKGITVHDNSVKLGMHRIDSDTTRISIRVGVFGDEVVSREILSRIDSNLELLRYEGSLKEQSNSIY